MQEDMIRECWRVLQENAPHSVSWNHYDLAKQTEINDVDVWREFLQRRDVSDWLEKERMLLQKYELAKLSTDVARSRSVGQAQLINAMERINNANKDNAKTGPIFIYTYIPLNAEQKNAPNTIELEEDIFHVDEPEFKFDPDNP